VHCGKLASFLTRSRSVISCNIASSPALIAEIASETIIADKTHHRKLRRCFPDIISSSLAAAQGRSWYRIIHGRDPINVHFLIGDGVTTVTILCYNVELSEYSRIFRFAMVELLYESIVKFE
jgi:hypothetical protein